MRHASKTDKVRWSNTAVGLVLIGLIVVFGVLPDTIHPLMVWAIVLGATGGALYLAFAYRRALSTWRGFAAVSAGCFATLAWLQWRPVVWRSPAAVVDAINMSAGLLTWALLLAVFVSSALLLIYRDTSVAFTAIATVLVMLILLVTSAQYARLEAFSNAPLAQQSFLGVPLVWGVLMLCLGPLAFVAHTLRLLIRELTSH